MSRNLKNLAALVVFGIAFGFVEAAVVDYIRHLNGSLADYSAISYHTYLNLGFVAFVSSKQNLVNLSYYHVELVRETATIVMLGALAYVSGQKTRQRWGAFLVAFACWDIFYYVFLKILLGWPAGLRTKDVFFLIPVAWIGPVVTPLVISLLMLLAGSKMYLGLNLFSRAKPSRK